jgi:hypothetical protein
MRFACVSGAVLSLVLMVEQAEAQNQPVTIPTVVAQAMTLESAMFGTSQYFDGRTPTDWPVALIPPGARVVGGGVVGDSAMFRMQTAVFAFSGQTNPNDVLRALLMGAGYVRHDLETAHGGGGFVGNESSTASATYCKGSSLATFGAVDSAQAPLVVAVHLLDGEVGRQNCASQRDRMMPDRFPVKVPTLTPPRGVMSFGGGSNWSGSGGNMRSVLRTTLPADSILFHYTAQLVAGGWRADGKPAIADGVGVQRFSFRDGQDAWTAALIIMAVGDRREVELQFTKVE